MRILFTGGSGKAGKHVVQHLVEQEHEVLNLDLVPSGIVGAHDMKVDLTDLGQVFSAMSGMVSLADLEIDGELPSFDAVVHFAAVPRIQLRSDSECFRINTTSTYNVLEAATKLRIPKVLIASSEVTYGVCFAREVVVPQYIPVDEEHPTVPHDAYAMSKVCNEICGRSFFERTGIDVYALRINNVVEPHEYEDLIPQWKQDANCRRRNIFAYIDTRDLSHFVDCALAKDGLGYQAFNVANPDTSVSPTNDSLIGQFYPDVPQKQELGQHQTFYSIEKSRALLGYNPQPRWRDMQK